MKFDVLPGLPPKWLDFVHGTYPGLVNQTLPELKKSLIERGGSTKIPEFLDGFLQRVFLQDASSYSDHVQQNIHRLLQPGSLAVTASIDPDIFGGTLSQFLKCLTVVQLSQNLSEASIDAVPVCWIRSRPGNNPDHHQVVHILDSRRDLQDLQNSSSQSETNFSGKHDSSCDHSAELVDEIERLGGGSFNTEILGILRHAYGPDNPGTSALERLFSVLMEKWGIVVLDSGSFSDAERARCIPDPEKYRSVQPVGTEYSMQFMALPNQVSVLSPFDLDAFSEACAIFSEQGSPIPFGWPSISATLVDKDSRRTMRKYGLQLQDLFDGEKFLIEDLCRGLPVKPAAEKLEVLNSEFEQRINAMDAGQAGRGSVDPQKNEWLRRINFQLNKIKGRFEAAGRQKLEVLQRRIPRLCNSLAPGGKIQECGLSGTYFLLLYSQELFPQLYKNLDFETWEHQMIDVF